MRFSDDKISHLSHVIFDGLVLSDKVERPADDAKLRREIKLALTRLLKVEDEVDDMVRKKVQSYSKKVLEGSPEWDVLYQKHYQEELKRRGKA